MGYVIYFISFIKPSLAQLVERGTVVKKVDIPRSPVQFRNGGFDILFCVFIGKFAQRSNLTKTEMVHEPSRFFELLYAAEFEVCDARMVNENMIEIIWGISRMN